MKALRIILYVLAGTVVLLVIAAVVFVRTFDLNDQKDRISAYVQERTGRSLTIEDNIEFSLFPWFAVETGRVHLSEDENFGNDRFVTIESLSARVRVWPLLKRRVEIGRVILDGIDLNLGVDADGRGNWASLLETSAPSAPDTDIPEPTRPVVETLAVEGVEIRNARILWRNADGDVTHILRNVSLTTGAINDSDPVDVTVSLSALDVASQASAEIDLETIASIGEAISLSNVDGVLRLLDPSQQVRLNTQLDFGTITILDGNVQTGPGSLAGRVTEPPLGPANLDFEAALSSIDFDLNAERLVVSGLSASTGGIQADVGLTAEALLTDPVVGATVGLQAQTLASVFGLLGRETPAAFTAVANERLVADGDLSFRLESRALAVPRFAVTTLGVEATGNALVADSGDIRGEISLPPFTPSPALTSVIASYLAEDVDLSAISTARLTAAWAIDRNTDVLEVRSVNLGLNTASLNGSVAIRNLSSPDRFQGEITATGFDNDLLAALAGSAIPSDLATADIGEFRLATNFDVERSRNVASFAPVEITAWGLSGEGELLVDNSSGSLALSGRASIDSFSPRELLARFELPIPQTSDSTALRSAQVAASFETSGSSGEFRDIAVTLDESRITGNFGVEDFANPSYRFLLRADRIDVDRYLPPSSPPGDAPAEAGTERRLGDMQLATEPLTSTVISGTASVGNLHIGGMDFEQLSTDVAFGRGQASINSVRTQLYGGSFEGSLSVDATGETGIVRLRGEASDVSISPLLQDMLGRAAMSGTSALVLNLTGRGDTINAALESASGSVVIEIADGEVPGFNLGHELCSAVNNLRNLPAPASAAEATPIVFASASAIVNEGVAATSDIYWTAGYMNLTGRGGVRIVDLWLDSQLRATLTGAPIPIAGCDSVNSTLRNDPVPFNFTIKGRYPNYERPGVDVSQLIQDIAGREIRQRAEESIRNRVLDNILN